MPFSQYDRVQIEAMLAQPHIVKRLVDAVLADPRLAEAVAARVAAVLPYKPFVPVLPPARVKASDGGGPDALVPVSKPRPKKAK